jgi:outer membrane lipoprotein-sorting protein
LAVVLVLLITLLAGCATRSDRIDSGLTLENSAALVTLSANMQLSYRTAEKHGSVRGMLMYRVPDHLRMVLLNPFGTTLVDLLMQKEFLTVLYPSNGVAFYGPVADLPAGLERQTWELLSWMLEQQPIKMSNGTYQQWTPAGTETVTVKGASVIAKRRNSGEQVVYSRYSAHNGVMLAQEVALETPDGDRIRIVLEDSDVNQQLRDEAFSISLKGVKVAPLSDFKTAVSR